MNKWINKWINEMYLTLKQRGNHTKEMNEEIDKK